jgi:hypothetical protein
MTYAKAIQRFLENKHADDRLVIARQAYMSYHYKAVASDGNITLYDLKDRVYKPTDEDMKATDWIITTL